MTEQRKTPTGERAAVARRNAGRRPPEPGERPISSLGRDLLALRAEIVASGIPLLTWEEVEQEVRIRRGRAGEDGDEGDLR